MRRARPSLYTSTLSLTKVLLMRRALAWTVKWGKVPLTRRALLRYILIIMGQSPPQKEAHGPLMSLLWRRDMITTCVCLFSYQKSSILVIGCSLNLDSTLKLIELLSSEPRAMVPSCPPYG